MMTSSPPAPPDANDQLSPIRSSRPEDVERLIEDYYTRVQITPAQQEALSGMLHHEFDRLMATETDELNRLTANRDRLEHEQGRLMQAHYAGAVPLPVLKREQDRILAELDTTNRRIDAHHGDYADARAHLDDALNLLANCAEVYERCDNANRRLCNQAFFTKIYIDEDDQLRVDNNRPFEMLLDPQINANALTWDQDSNKARTETIDDGRGSNLVRGWTQWSATGTGDHGLRGLFPHGIKDLKSPSSPWVSPTTHSSRRQRSQGDALEQS